MNVDLIWVFVATALAAALPLLWASVGESVGELSGVLNVGIEGVMLIGGYTAFVVALGTESPLLAFLSAAAVGSIAALVMVALSVWGGADQIVVGLAITLAGTGLSTMLYERFFSESRPRLGAAEPVDISGVSLFDQPAMFFVGLVITALVGMFVARTTFGLRLRAAGFNPKALSIAGGNTQRSRTAAVLFGGVMAGVGGAYLVLITAGTFTPLMTNGIGYLAVVAAMIARGRQHLVLVVALGFGVLVAAGSAVQLVGVNVSSEVISSVPFALVLVVLTVRTLMTRR